ncbi:hypothetical protein Bca101_037684 [Brassica carinata]
MSSTISNDQSDNFGYRGPAWWNLIYTQTQRTIKGKVVPHRTKLGYNGWERTTSTTSRAMIGGSFIKEDMV